MAFPRLLFFGFLLVASVVANAREFPRPPQDVDLIGALSYARVQEGDTLLDVARRFGLGQNEIVIANPDLDRWLPEVGAEVLLPSRYILPRSQREGITLNVAEMRLYYYPPAPSEGEAVVITHPVSIGRMDWTTPLGRTRIVRKVRNPSWYPPESIREEAAERGETLPEVIPPGPDNPLGQLAMRLDIPGYLIHSTNRPYGIGMRVTHGCVRMYPEDIRALFEQVEVDTPVYIVDQPVKLGWLGDTLFIEIHPPLDEADMGEQELLRQAMDLVQGAFAQRPGRIQGRALRRAVTERSGVPRAIGRADGGR